jgi:hypothetical protein
MTKARNFSAKVQIEFADRREMAQTPDPLRSLSGSREGSPYRAFNFADRVGASESLRQHMDIIDGILSWTPKMRQLAKVEPCP